MFMLWTIATLWILYLFDNGWFERPIRNHSIQSLQVFMPMSIFEWILIISWIIPLLFVIFYMFFKNRLRHTNKGSLVPPILPIEFSGMRRFDWIFILVCSAVAIAGWTIQTAELLLPATIIVVGLSFSKFERWCIA